MIYLDNAATTKVHPEVFKAMYPYLNEKYGNPSGIYRFSKSVKDDIEEARNTVAASINALPEEIFFTSGGTESDNWALKMVAKEKKGGHIVTSMIEHKAVLNSADRLEKNGYKVTRVKPNEEGIIDVRNIEKNIKPSTFLVSVMAANNEIGTIEPIAEIGNLSKEYGCLFHTDAVQAYTNIPIDVKAMNINMLSASGHKICGPKGIGFLYIEKGVLNTPFINGGGQENGMRSGTENVAGIVGMAKAVKIAMGNMAYRVQYEIKMRDYMTGRILREIDNVKLNGHESKRLPGNMNFSFYGVDGATLILMLDKQGICASAGSACSSFSGKPSHVLIAIGVEEELAHGSVRFTINEHITKQEADYVIECLKRNISILRNV